MRVPRQRRIFLTPALVVAALGQLAVALPIESQEDTKLAEPVSMIQLITNPSKYYQKLVRVTGIYRQDPDKTHSSLCLTKDLHGYVSKDFIDLTFDSGNLEMQPLNPSLRERFFNKKLVDAEGTLVPGSDPSSYVLHLWKIQTKDYALLNQPTPSVKPYRGGYGTGIPAVPGNDSPILTPQRRAPAP